MTLLFVLALSTQTALAPPVRPTEVAPVVVTAPRPRQAGQALEDCLARKCSPGEDMRASLQAVNESFLAGDYPGARTLVADAIRRNRKFADREPVLLAGLYKSQTTVTQHMGLGAAASRAAGEVPPLLERRYGAASPEVLWARLQAADTAALADRPIEAKAEYNRLQDDARKAGLQTLAEVVELRLAWAPALSGRRQDALDELDRLMADSGPGEEQRALAARLQRLKLLPPAERDRAAREGLAEQQLLSAEGRPPVLLWAPPAGRLAMKAIKALPHPSNPYEKARPGLEIGNQYAWVDVGFWINASGRVDEAEILRSHPDAEGWAPQALDLVNRRLYAPSADPQSRTYQAERLAVAVLVKIEKRGSRYYGRRVAAQMHSTSLRR